MEYFWKENKKFLISVGAGLLVVLLYRWFVLSPINAKADAAASRLSAEERSLSARVERGGVAEEDTIKLAENELRRTKDLLASLAADMSFKEGERFQKPENQTWVEHYNAEKLEVFNRLKEIARPLSNYPKEILGLREAEENINEILAQELLLRLAVVDRLVRAAVEARVDRIDVIDAVPLVHSGSRRDEVVTKKCAFLNKYTVHMAFKGEQRAVFKVLHEIQKKGSFLAVSQFDVDHRDPTKDYLEAVLRVSLLKIDPKAPLEAKEEGASEVP